MTLKRKDFAGFFAALHDSAAPFAWQERLLDELLEAGSWPGRIVAPTGAGKTAAIDVHVFAVALTADTGGQQASRLPRRLAMVVGRRVLVDDQYRHAEVLREALAEPPADEVAKVADRLRWLRWPAGEPPRDDDDRSPLVVARLRGGAAPPREWRDHPTACAVICGTPDMWGSRLLFRGYGSARLARPREAGLLALDAAVVVDEAHLSQQLLTTARQVARLVTVAEEPVPVPALQVVETTATPAGSGVGVSREVGVVDDDLAVDEVLRDRMCRPKPVTEVPVPDWPAATAPQRRRVAARLADEVVALLSPPSADRAPAHTVGCYVNTVAMAVDVAGLLRSCKRPDGAPVRVVMVCGQTRPADLELLKQEHSGMLTVTGDPAVDVLVTTQSLEVGVDLDLAAVVTELAPGSALAQRAGRVNRRGRRPAGQVRVIVPARKLAAKDHSGPYGKVELVLAHGWLTSRAADPAGLAPWAIRNDPPPEAERRRIQSQRPELADTWQWACTSDQLAAEPELDLWLAESFDEQSTAGLVVRDAMPSDAGDAVALVRLLRPREREVFTVPVATVREVAQAAAETARSGGADQPDPPLVVRVRGDDIAIIDPDTDKIGPGDVVVIDSRTVAFTRSTSADTGGFSPQVPVRPRAEAIDAVLREPAADVLHTGTPPVGKVALRLEPAAWSGAVWVEGLLKEYAEAAEDTTDSARRRILKRLLTAYTADQDLAACAGMVADTIELLKPRRVRDSELVLHLDDTGAPVRLLVIDRRRAWADEQLRQTWLPQREVALDKHQAAVGDRAAWVAAMVGLPALLVNTLRNAGMHHDDGKADGRFQAGLRAADTPLAKSGGVPLDEFRRLIQQAGLPDRWRHEQRSVVACWEAIHTALPQAHAELAARLVGTSHGHGRGGFPHTVSELLTTDDPDTSRRLAEELFDLGLWDDLIETTHRRFGAWGCAYLEALLRAADGQASAEGT